MLGKVLSMEYGDHGSSIPNAYYKIATDQMILHFMTHLNSQRSPQLSDSSLEITYLDSSVGEIVLRDQLFLKDHYQIQAASRSLLDANGNKITSNQVPTGIFIYNFENRADWEKNGRKDEMQADEQIRVQLAERTNALVSEFRESFGAILTRRMVRIGELYPIDQQEFFERGSGQDIGPIFAERFWVDDSAGYGGAGFHLSADTDRYQLRFDHHQGYPGYGTRLSVNRGNYGFSVDFDESLGIDRIQEIGVPAICVDKTYSKKDLKAGQGRIIKEKVSSLWAEFRREFSIDQRIRECAELTSEELAMVQPLLAYLAGRGELPLRTRIEQR